MNPILTLPYPKVDTVVTVGVVTEEGVTVGVGMTPGAEPLVPLPLREEGVGLVWVVCEEMYRQQGNDRNRCA